MTVRKVGPTGLLVLAILSVGPMHASNQAFRPPVPTDLMCELMAWPELTVVRDLQPDFRWVAKPVGYGSLSSIPQKRAHQILVASSRAVLEADEGDMWDSGKVVGLGSSGVEYAGKPLAPGRTYFWKVRVYDHDGVASAYSQSQMFRIAESAGAYETSRYRLVKTPVKPVRVVEKGRGHYFVDFGRAAFGTVELTLASTRGGEQVEVHLGEVPAGDSAVERKPGGARRYRVMTLELDPGTHTYTVAITPDKRNTGSRAIKMPPETGEVMPFRYCEIVNSPSPLDASKVREIAVHYPFDESASQFSSSNQVLNDVWDLCKYSIKATSFCGVYVDGDRERIPYEADAYIN